LSMVVDLRELATPLSECLTVRKGDVESGLVASLRANDFEQAPVLGEDGEPFGVIATDILEQLRSEGRQLDLTNEAIDRTRLAYLSPMGVLLAALGASRGVIVGTDRSEPRGLVTLSDLNRHEFRRYLYGALAEMEALLAQLIDV